MATTTNRTAVRVGNRCSPDYPAKAQFPLLSKGALDKGSSFCPAHWRQLCRFCPPRFARNTTFIEILSKGGVYTLGAAPSEFG